MVDGSLRVLTQEESAIVQELVDESSPREFAILLWQAAMRALPETARRYVKIVNAEEKETKPFLSTEEEQRQLLSVSFLIKSSVELNAGEKTIANAVFEPEVIHLSFSSSVDLANSAGILYWVCKNALAFSHYSDQPELSRELAHRLLHAAIVLGNLQLEKILNDHAAIRAIGAGSIDRSFFQTLAQPPLARPETFSPFRLIKGSKDPWSFWRDWYQGFLDGKPLDWELQRRVALIPDEDWDKGPEHIAQLIDQIRKDFDRPVLNDDQIEEQVGRLRAQPVTTAFVTKETANLIDQAIHDFMRDNCLNDLPEALSPLTNLPERLRAVATAAQPDGKLEDLERQIEGLIVEIAQLTTKLETAKARPA
jgi:hypothetical protein